MFLNVKLAPREFDQNAAATMPKTSFGKKN